MTCSHIESYHRDGCKVGNMWCPDCNREVHTPEVIETILDQVFMRKMPSTGDKK